MRVILSDRGVAGEDGRLRQKVTMLTPDRQVRYADREEPKVLEVVKSGSMLGKGISSKKLCLDRHADQGRCTEEEFENFFERFAKRDARGTLLRRVHRRLREKTPPSRALARVPGVGALVPRVDVDE